MRIKEFTCELPESEIVGNQSRYRKRFTYPEIYKALIAEIGKWQALNTDNACERLGLALGIIEQERTSPEFWTFVYLRLRCLDKRGALVSAKIWNGKTYERLWRKA